MLVKYASIRGFLVASMMSPLLMMSGPSYAQHVHQDSSNHVDHSSHMGHSDHAEHKARMKEVSGMVAEPADVRLSDALVLDQAGTKLELESEVLNENIVVVDFIFTTCTTICPVTTALLAATKRDYPELAGTKYVSISIDPNTDTPARLTQFAQKHKADWTFLTGKKAIIDQVLLDMDAYSTNPEDHAPMILVGDASTGEFVRLFGLPRGDEIKSHVERLELARLHAQHEKLHGHH